MLVFERIYGVKIDDIDAMEAAGIDRKAVAFNSARIIVKEVLVDGFFHADPHPGNFLVMPDAVIGAMDFGMVGYLDKKLRVDLIRLYAASVEMDEDAVVEQLIRMGAVGEDVERRGLARDIQRLLNKYRGMSLKEVRATEVVTDIMPVAFRHRLRLPTDLWLLGKTLGMMEGIGLQLDPDFDMFAVSEPIVRRLLLRLMLPDRSWPRDAMIMGQEWIDVAALLPKATRRVLQQAERGELFSLSIKETDRALRLLDRLATRLAVSILIAALTIGLAFLVPITSGNLLARAVTVAGFVVSVTMGAWLIFSMWRSRRH